MQSFCRAHAGLIFFYSSCINLDFRILRIFYLPAPCIVICFGNKIIEGVIKISTGGLAG